MWECYFGGTVVVCTDKRRITTAGDGMYLWRCAVTTAAAWNARSTPLCTSSRVLAEFFVAKQYGCDNIVHAVIVATSQYPTTTYTRVRWPMRTSQASLFSSHFLWCYSILIFSPLSENFLFDGHIWIFFYHRVFLKTENITWVASETSVWYSLWKQHLRIYYFTRLFKWVASTLYILHI